MHDHSIIYVQQPDGALRGYRLVPIDGAAPQATQPSVQQRDPLDAAVEQERAKLYGHGHDLYPGLRSTDPRIFAVGFSRDHGGPQGRGWTQAAAAAAADSLLNRDRQSRTLRPKLETRRITTANYGFHDGDLAAQWLYRVTSERTPAAFDLATLVGVELQDGIYVYLADRVRPARYRDLPRVADLLAPPGE